MTETPAASPLVAVLVTDLFFAVPIADAVRAAGARPQMVDDAAQLAQAIDLWPALVLIDLAAPGDWHAVVRRAKALPHTRPIPIVAFGSHMNTGALQAARAAGCDHAWARSRFMAELPRLLQGTLNPVPASIDECNDPAPSLLLTGVQLFNRGEYWECHEVLETLWRAEERPIRNLYQGILQIGVAFHHLRALNYEGTLKCLRRGLPRLRTFPGSCQGLPVAALAQAALRVHDQVLALGPDRIGEFDLSTLPRLELSPATRPELP